ncbi:MAG: hypothetical protein Kow0049_12270 [Stanieria sp.]
MVGSALYTEIAKSVKGSAIAETVLGAIIDIYISLIVTDFPRLGFAVFNDFNSIYLFPPLLGSGVGALTIGLIAALSGGNLPKPDVDLTRLLSNYAEFSDSWLGWLC